MFYVRTLVFLAHFIFINTSYYHRENHCDMEIDAAPIVEFYKKDDSLYMLFSERVAWYEAASVCKTYEALLCIPNSTAKANFVARFLSESNFRFEDFWIGARKIKGQWIWSDGEPLKDFNITILWQWATNGWGKDCLAIERHSQRTPMYVDLSCYLPKPFICERPISARTKRPLPSLPTQSVKVNDSVFTFYHSRISWNDALAFCRSLGQRLAILPDKKIIKILTSEILRSRPDTENVWIGAYYDQPYWLWISTGVIIPNKTQEDGYPPWYTNSTRKQTKGCVLFDRHLTKSYFIPERCKRRRDFICETYVPNPIPMPISNDTVVCIHGSILMYIYLIDKTWKAARKFCNDNGTILAEPLDNATLKAIAVCLGDQPGGNVWLAFIDVLLSIADSIILTKPKHAWLGGKYYHDKWMWVNSNKEISKSLPWCDDEFEENSQCLNMDRTNHDEPWIYGLKCKRKQPFVCQDGKILSTTTTEEPKSTTEELTTPSTEEPITTEFCVCPCEQPAIPMFYLNRTFIAFMFFVEAEEIPYYCQHFGGVVVPNTLPQVYTDYILAYINEQMDRCGCCTDDLVNFWITDDCTAINLNSGEISTTMDCTKENPFLCETFCETVPKLEVNENATINCPWLIAAGKIPYRSCKFSCGYDYSIVGPDRLTCDAYGWKIYTVEDTVSPVLFPECIKTEETAEQLANLLYNFQPEGLYFIVRETQTDTQLTYNTFLEWSALLQFILSIIQIYPLSNDVPLGMLSFSDEAHIRIAYNATDSCDVLRRVRVMKPASDAKKAMYDVAMSTVVDEIEKYQPDRRTAIFFLIDRENTGDDYDRFVQKLHVDHLLFVIGITRNKFIYDLDMVASLSRTYMLHTIKVIDYMSLINISLDLTDLRSPNINCSKDLYVMPDLFPKSDIEDKFPKTRLDIIQLNDTYYFLKNYIPHHEALYLCVHKFGGRLIEIIDAERLVNSANIKQFHITQFWVRNSIACQTMDVYSKQLQKPDCESKHPFICVADCSVVPPLNEDDLSQEIGDKYIFHCNKYQDILWGPSILSCNRLAGGWTTGSIPRISPFPTCIDPSVWIKNMEQIFDFVRTSRQASVLFVLDESKSVFKEQFKIQTKFVETIVKLYPATNLSSYGVITFHAEAKVQIPYNQSDSCKIVQKLALMKQKLTTESACFEKALLEVDKEVTKFRPNELSLIFFLTNGLFAERILTIRGAKANLLRYNVEIYVLKLGTFDSDVSHELPTRDSKYNFNLYNFQTYQSLGRLTDQLPKGMYVHRGMNYDQIIR